MIWKFTKTDLLFRFHYKVAEAQWDSFGVLQSRVGFCITKRGKWYYKVGHILQSRTIFTTKWGRYCKVSQLLLQNRAGIAKCVNYYNIRETLECLIDVPSLTNFSIFFHPGHFYSNPRLLIVGENFQFRQTFWNNILVLPFLAKGTARLYCVLFYRFM